MISTWITTGELSLDRLVKAVFDTIFSTVKVTDFPVVMYGCESWTVKKAKDQSIDAL